MTPNTYTFSVRTTDGQVRRGAVQAETFSEAYDMATRAIDSIMISGAVISSASDPDLYTIFGDGA